MKIAQIVCAYPPYQGGIGNSAKKFKELLEKKHKIKTFTPQYKKQKNKEDDVVRLKPLIKYGNAAILPQFFYLLKKYDCIILHYPFFGTDLIIWLYKILFGKNKKLIIHYHMDVYKKNLWMKLTSFPSEIIRKSLLKKADKITCFSLDYIKNSQISKIYKKDKNKFIKIPYGIDIKKFYPQKKYIKEGIMKIIFVGGLDDAHYFKGLSVLIKAIELSKEKIELSVVGEGNKKEYFKNLTKLKGLQDKILFLDPVENSELPKIYRENDILILPSIDKSEALGIVLLEAMASGLGVVASDLAGVRSVFEDQKEGLKIKPNNPRDLKEKLDYLAKNCELRKIMGEKARKKIEIEYSLNKMSKKLNLIF
ncbi:glycosyltransferase family 4 protein [bacterium]|nr:glycosyltransferase family 4 protein [bacterium]